VKTKEHNIETVEDQFFLGERYLSFSTELWRNESKFNSKQLLEVFSALAAIVVRERTAEMGCNEPHRGWRKKRIRFCFDLGCSNAGQYKFTTQPKPNHAIHATASRKSEDEVLLFVTGSLPDVRKYMSAGELMGRVTNEEGDVEVDVSVLVETSLYSLSHYSNEISMYSISSVWSLKEKITEEVKKVRPSITVHSERRRVNGFLSPDKIESEAKKKLSDLLYERVGDFSISFDQVKTVKMKMHSVQELLEKIDTNEALKDKVTQAVNRLDVVLKELASIKSDAEKEMR